MGRALGLMISVIIPIFRVEAYIERCARSLLGQTMEDVEFIFVDDCSPDSSIANLRRVLAEYPNRNVHLLRHTSNRGLPAARNTGMAKATGDYIFHCDSDDYLAPDALKKMYDAAKRGDADIVYTDWFLTFPTRKRYMQCPAYPNTKEALRGLLHGTMKYNVWNKLVKRTLYTENHISFPEGHDMGEDMTMILLFAKAHRIAYLPHPTYHYVRQNENALTAVRSEASYEDLLYNATRIIKELNECVASEDLACFKLNVKLPFLISDRSEDYERWQKWFPESNRYITIHQVSTRARILEYCARMHIFFPLQLHYQLLRIQSF